MRITASALRQFQFRGSMAGLQSPLSTLRRRPRERRRMTRGQNGSMLLSCSSGRRVRNVLPSGALLPNSAGCAVGRPKTFVLEFTHICGTKRNGRGFELRRKTKLKRKWATVSRFGAELRRMQHEPIDEQDAQLAPHAGGALCLLRSADQHRGRPHYSSALQDTLPSNITISRTAQMMC
jgi:hypothetical protein